MERSLIVADAGPLIGLARVDRLSLLSALYGGVVIPEPVRDELCLDSNRPGARALSLALAAGTIRAQALAPGVETDLAGLSLLLDPGESAAIVLAEQLRCRFLLIDEQRGREIARRRGIQVVGVAGLLLAAKRAGHLEAVEPTLVELTRQGYRLSNALLSEVLRLANELPSDGES